MIRTRCLTVQVRACDAKPSPMASLRKKAEATRSSLLKDNLNKLGVIATADLKFIQEIAKELDTVHKEWFEEQNQKRSSAPQEESKGDDNIFASKR